MPMIAGKPLKAWIWPMASLLLILVSILLLVLILGQGDTLSKHAYDEGRRLAISLQDGEIDGLPLMTPKEQPAQEPEEPEIKSGAAGDFSDGKAEPLEPPLAPKETDHAEATPPADPAGEEAPAKQPSEAAPEATTPAEAPVDYPEAVEPEPETQKTTTAAPTTSVVAHQLANKEDDLPLPAPGKALAPAPNPKLVEQHDLGILPRIGTDGTTPWQYYAKPVDLPVTDSAVKQPLVAIIVTGLGLGRFTTEAAMKLLPEFTFSFSPYSRDGALWAKHARDHGHEVLVDLPMQPVDYPATDPGPYALLNNIKVKENRTRLHTVMSRFPGYVGFLAPRKAAAPKAVILSAMAQIAGRGLLLVDQPGPAADALKSKKEELGLIDLNASSLLDANLNKQAIQKEIQKLVKKAKKEGHAIGVVRPYPLSLDTLRKWATELEKSGVMLVPVSTIANRL